MDRPEGESVIANRRLYTPAMLASLLGVSVASVRSWHRRGLIQAVETLNRVPYFDFAQLAAGRQLTALIGQGITPAALQRKLDQLSRWLPDSSLDRLSLSVEGNEVLLRRDGCLLESGGQKRFDFSTESPHSDQKDLPPNIIPLAAANQ